ncbi:MAG: 1-acyl-sn-glycerol-3-phosphate acyltransferase [Microthrixaceae bacterium]|nr:1-acyl-sn-glycerol-3-phosphate acyltransferase [Microthrixaceae bacterium]
MLWVVSGFGWKLNSDRMQRAHVALAGWFVGGLIGSARRVLGLRVVTDQVPTELRVSDPLGARAEGDATARPVLVFSRHAGAGDSFVLVDAILNAYGRRPRIVLKDELRWDPCIDVALSRIPSQFIQQNPPKGSGVVESIAELASDLGSDGALILFPEGGNFTRRRRFRAINRLREDGLDDLVERAERFTQVLPPRPHGAFAAIDAAPEADVLFVAHTGLEQLGSVRQIWSGLPMRSEVRLTSWLVPAEHVPSGYTERVAWLYAWWEHIDRWIDDNRPVDAPAGPLGAMP